MGDEDSTSPPVGDYATKAIVAKIKKDIEKFNKSDKDLRDAANKLTGISGPVVIKRINAAHNRVDDAATDISGWCVKVIARRGWSQSRVSNTPECVDIMVTEDILQEIEEFKTVTTRLKCSHNSSM